MAGLGAGPAPGAGLQVKPHGLIEFGLKEFQQIVTRFFIHGYPLLNLFMGIVRKECMILLKGNSRINRLAKKTCNTSINECPVL
jgi:hypothetical protein